MLDIEFDALLSGFNENREFNQLNLNFLDWYRDKTKRKLEVCERLKKIEGTPLKALLIFDENSYETHFTKYHLNLESYSDILHGLLRLELEEKFILEYKKVENAMFQIISKIDENSTLSHFFKMSSELMAHYEKMMRFPQQFLKVQFRFHSLEKEIKKIIKDHSEFSKKLSDIAKRVKLLGKEKRNIIEIITLFNEFTIKRFHLFNPDDVSNSKIISFIEMKDISIEDEVLLPVLEVIEPSLVNSIKNRIIKVLKAQGDYSKLNMNSQFLMRRSKRSIFENRQYYSHEMLTYQFLPETSEYIKMKNQYLNTAGYEKIFIEKKTLRIKSEVYSKTYDKKITYTVFIELDYYMLNPHISQRYA